MPRARGRGISIHEMSRRIQAVEKVVVGPVGSPKQLQNVSQPMWNTTKPGFKALVNEDQKTIQGGF